MDLGPTFSATETITAQLRLILRGILAGLGMWRLEMPQMLLAHRRISASFQKIERLLQRFRAGRLWQILQRTRGQRPHGRRVALVVLPRRFGWLVMAGGSQAACVGSQLQAVLNTPEMVELLAVSAQAGRILRPLCRALAVELPGMVGVTACAGERAIRRKRRPRAVPEPFSIPLPRGVLAAARRDGFGKDR